MMPWGHAAVATLPYLAYQLVVHRRLPPLRPLLVLLVATQLPDLIDKPLAWTVGLIPSGRMLAHSVVIAVPIVLLVAWFAWRTDHLELAPVFAFGFLSHLYADSYHLVFQGSEYYFLPNLFWPLVPAVPDLAPSFSAHLARIDPSAAAPFLVLFAVLGILVLRSQDAAMR